MVNEYHKKMVEEVEVHDASGKAFRHHIPSSRHHSEIMSRKCKDTLDVKEHFVNILPIRYAFEVYFMGIRVYSKIESRQWPHCDLLAKRCAKMY